MRFLVEFSPGQRRESEICRPDRVAAALDAVVDLAELARDQDAPVQVSIDDDQIADLVRRALAGQSGASLVLADRFTWQTARMLGDLYTVADVPELTEAYLPPVVVGTDGSADRLAGAWAWVDAESGYGSGSASSCLIDACELEAIWQALRCAGERDVVVMTDSRHAMSHIRRPDSASGRVMDMARKVRDAIARRERAGHGTTIGWVHGHTGVGVNEIAHRLALNALRHQSLGTPDAMTAAVAAEIVSDLTDHNPPTLHRRWTLHFGTGPEAGLLRSADHRLGPT